MSNTRIIYVGGIKLTCQSITINYSDIHGNSFNSFNSFRFVTQRDITNKRIKEIIQAKFNKLDNIVPLPKYMAKNIGVGVTNIYTPLSPQTIKDHRLELNSQDKPSYTKVYKHKEIV